MWTRAMADINARMETEGDGKEMAVWPGGSCSAAPYHDPSKRLAAVRM